MIRKPTEKDFQEGEAVKALRETHKITVEGSKGIGKGLGRVYLGYMGLSLAFGLGISLVIATSGIALVPMVLGGIWYMRWRKERDAAHVAALREQQDRIERDAQRGRMASAAAGQRVPGDVDVAFPPDVRRRGVIEADIGAVMSQAFMLLLVAFGLLFVGGIASGLVGWVVGAIALMLAALIGSRAFGHRKIIEWDTRKVKVWHLLGEAEMQWSDVVDVTVEKQSRYSLYVYFQSGTRRNIVIRALVNRLGGPTTLRVPIRHMNLPRPELENLLRDLMCWRAAGHAAEPDTHRREPERDAPFGRAVTPSSDPRDSFDPDEIMARYLRDRERTLEAAARGAGEPQRPRPTLPNPADQRPVFGRKRA